MGPKGPAPTNGGGALPSPRSPLPLKNGAASASSSGRCAHSEKGESGGRAGVPPRVPRECGDSCTVIHSNEAPVSVTGNAAVLAEGAVGAARCDARTRCCAGDTRDVKRAAAGSPPIPFLASAAAATAAAGPVAAATGVPGIPASGGKADAGRTTPACMRSRVSGPGMR